MNSGGYSLLDRALHRLVLRSRTVQRASFDFECNFHSRRPRPGVSGAPVFVTGLARSGTTALLRTLYATGEFESLTYRDMPFVLMPQLWSSVSGRFYKAAVPSERAHGDSVLVDFDSPEGFECVFWRTFSSDTYDRDDHLPPCDPDEEVLEKFRTYVSSIAARSPGAPKRYLSKNNNNLIRLGALQRAFGDARILVLYRDPLQTAASSLRQHLRFCEAQRKDPFIREYMDLLEHYEFGLGHKPFRLSAEPTSRPEPEAPDYWLGYWNHVYEYLLGTSIPFHFVNYETLCTCSEPALRLIFETLGLRADPSNFAASLRLAATASLPDFDPALADRSRNLYRRISEDRRNLLCLD